MPCLRWRSGKAAPCVDVVLKGPHCRATATERRPLQGRMAESAWRGTCQSKGRRLESASHQGLASCHHAGVALHLG
eukprot:15260614-Alexandrium_andersonii.AAC.1